MLCPKVRLGFSIMPNRGRGRGRRGRRRLVTGRQLHNVTHGHVIRTPFDPPNFVDKPWNSVTVEIAFQGDKQVKCSDIAPVVLTQLGLDELKTTTIELRFMKARIWGLSVSRPLRVSFFGSSAASAGGAQAYGIVQDWGAPMRLPHVGWVWPVAIQQITWISTSSDLVMSVDVGTTGGLAATDIPWLAYMDVLWRSSKYNPISSRPRYVATYTPSALSESFSNLSLGN